MGLERSDVADVEEQEKLLVLEHSDADHNQLLAMASHWRRENLQNIALDIINGETSISGGSDCL